jgi:antirestriction protein ArdC
VLCERIVAGMPHRPVVEQSDRAWYAPSRDVVGMPSIGLFRSSEEYYSTLFHELTHPTGHSSRVGREGFESLQSFGSESYSKEELVAELGAAMLCGVTGIENRTIENSAAYLNSWIARLKSDSRLIVTAASAAQRAADYILGKQMQDGGVRHDLPSLAPPPHEANPGKPECADGAGPAHLTTQPGPGALLAPHHLRSPT